MARSAVLNIIFGAETGQLERALGGVQKRLRRTAGEFQRLGDSMSRSVSLPIIGVGAAAIKSAADLETLETSFISLAGGANQAAQLVSQLNDFTAKTPFQLEQVGAAARQLIAAGTPIQEVQNQLQFLGDIAATSGSNIDEIASIFSKVQAKGKVELESLNQLAERGIPIFKALSDATGLPADALGAGAVSVEQFNSVLSSFSEEGGFAAGAMERLSQTAAGKFSTALDNLKLAGAELGAQLLPIIKDLLDDVVEVAQSFAKLDNGTKKLILQMGAFAAAIGPVSSGIGKTLNGIADMKTAFAGLAKRAPKFAAALGSPWTIAAAAVIAFGIAAYEAQRPVTDLQDKVEDFASDLPGAPTQNWEDYMDAIDRGTASLGQAATGFSTLRKEIEDTAATAAENQAWVDSFRAGSPVISEILDLFTNYDEQLKDAAKAAADLEKAEQNATSNAYFAAEAEKTLAREAAARAEKEAAAAAQRAAEAERLRIAQLPTLQELQSEAFKTEQALAKLYDEAALGIQVDPTEVNALKDSLKEVEKQIDTLGGKPINVKVGLLANLEKVEVGPQIGDLLGGLEDVEVGPQIGDLLGALEVESSGVQQYIQELKDLQAEYNRAAQEAQFFESATQAIEGAIESSVISIATAVGAAAAGVTEPLKNLGTTLLSTFASLAMELGGLAIGYGIAIESIKEALKSLSGPIAIAAGIALLALGAGLQAAVSKSAGDAGVPAFAQGGLVTGPTLAMVGDNASGKEAIIPFERMGEFMKMAGADRGSQAVTVTGRISGKDIVLSNQRGSRDRSRIR